MRPLHRVTSEGNMLYSQKRSLKSRQIGLVQTHHKISGTAATPADSGIDAAYVLSVTDVGVGVQKINFKAKSLRNIDVSGLVLLTGSRSAIILAVDKESVTVETRDGGGILADSDYAISCIHATTVEAVF